mgnify:CR=1 FL=1
MVNNNEEEKSTQNNTLIGVVVVLFLVVVILLVIFGKPRVGAPRSLLPVPPPPRRPLFGIRLF